MQSDVNGDIGSDWHITVRDSCWMRDIDELIHERMHALFGYLP